MTHALSSPAARLARIALCLGAAALLGGCAGADTDPDEENVHETGLTFEEFEARTYQEPETGVYIVDGDIAIPDEEHLRTFYEQYIREGKLAIRRTGFIFLSDTKWSDTQKLKLEYCVSTTFGDRYAEIVQTMHDAASAWEGAADVHFIHRDDQDGNCNANNTNVLFDVNPTSGQKYDARSFFPDYSRAYRNILVNQSAYTSVNPLVGIMRHELGHILGFIHEHIRPEAPHPYTECESSESFRGITAYDSASVMHYYWCGGTAGAAYELSANDKSGVATIYGASKGPWVRIKTSNGHYLIAWGGGGGALMSDSTFPGEWESFKLISVGPSQYALRSWNGVYVSAEGGGGGDVNVNRSSVGSWETFTMYAAGAGNQHAFRASNGKYLSAYGGGGSVVKADGPAINSWETFSFEYW